MEIKNFRIAYSDYDVTSTLYQKVSADKLAEQLNTVAPTPVSYTHLTLPTICSV